MTNSESTNCGSQTLTKMEVPHFRPPFDWGAIDDAIVTVGGVILERVVSAELLASLNSEFDAFLSVNTEQARPDTSSEIYDSFLGHKTLRLHGLIEKIPSAADMIGKKELLDWAERMLAPVSRSVLLNAAELIEIQPGEPAQFLHRDSDSWPLPTGGDPIIVNAIVALDPCTLENGATYVVPGSWQWNEDRAPEKSELARAVMAPGDALYFRGDILHGGGENVSEERRRALSLSYCAGWLRPVENSFLNLSRNTVRDLPERLQGVLGYAVHNQDEAIIGLYENGDPARALHG